MMNKQKINDIKERLSKLRSLSWKSYIEGRDHEAGDSFIMVGEGDNRGEDIYLTGATDDEQDFIAHAPEDISFLLKEIEKLEIQNDSQN